MISCRGGFEIRILFIAQGYPPERVGGVEVYLKGLAGELCRDHEVRVITRSVSNTAPSGESFETVEDGVPVTWLPVNMRDLKEFRNIYQRPWIDEWFKKIIDESRPEVVHFQHLGGLSLEMVRIAADAGAAVVMTLSDHQPYCPRGQRIRNDKRMCKSINLDECLECLKPQTVGQSGRTAKLASYLLGKEKGLQALKRMHGEIAETFARVGALIMPSEFHRSIMVEAGAPAQRSRVMAYGLNLSALDQVEPRPAGAPVRKFGYLGTLIPSKGVEDVIQAFKRMKTPGCSLHIFGEAVPYHGMTDYDQRLIEMARAADISFYGPYQPADLVRVLSRLDAVVMPSRWYESYGITIREAFRARRPVIVSDVGAFAEAVEDGVNGLTFPAGDVFALGQAMDRLASDSELAERMAAAGGPMSDIGDHARELVALYEQLRRS